jgi:hypothetical protein
MRNYYYHMSQSTRREVAPVTPQEMEKLYASNDPYLDQDSRVAARGIVLPRTSTRKEAGYGSSQFSNNTGRREL